MNSTNAQDPAIYNNKFTLTYAELQTIVSSEGLSVGSFYVVTDVLDTVSGGEYLFQATDRSSVNEYGTLEHENGKLKVHYDYSTNRVDFAEDRYGNKIGGVSNIQNFLWFDSQIHNNDIDCRCAINFIDNDNLEFSGNKLANSTISISSTINCSIRNNVLQDLSVITKADEEDSKVSRNRLYNNSSIVMENGMNNRIVDNEGHINCHIEMIGSDLSMLRNFKLESLGRLESNESSNIAAIGSLIRNNSNVYLNGTFNVLFNTLVCDTVCDIDLTGSTSVENNPLSFIQAYHHSNINLSDGVYTSIQGLVAEGRSVVEASNAVLVGYIYGVKAESSSTINFANLSGDMEDVTVRNGHTLNAEVDIGFKIKRCILAMPIAATTWSGSSTFAGRRVGD